MTKPNLFSFATSELSQDAILAWLIQWADPKFSTIDEGLHQTGRQFIREMFEKSTKAQNAISWSEMPEITAIRIEPQRYKIDLLIWLECKDGIDRIILIEDKVHSGEHHNQLNKYLEKLTDSHAPRERILPVLIKTGYQHDWSTVEAEGYVSFTAEDLINLWQFGFENGVENDIFTEYGEYLKTCVSEYREAQRAFHSFDDVLVKDWKHWHWIGFFEKMKTILPHFGSANSQFRRNNMLSCWFGFNAFEFDFDGETIKYGPNFDLAIVDDRPSLTVRMWIQHLTQVGIGFRDLRENILSKLDQLNLGQKGKFRDANDSILLLKLPLDIEKMAAKDLEKHLLELVQKLHSIEK